MTDPIDLDAIEAKVNAAKPGPWWLVLGERHMVGTRHEFPSLEIRHGDPNDDRDSYDLLESYEEADYRFLTEARQDIPALIARVRELEKEADAVEKALRLAHEAILTTIRRPMGVVPDVVDEALKAIRGLVAIETETSA